MTERRPASRSCSGGNKYFEYKGTHLKDPYLLGWESRKKQEQLSSRFMGVEALRYVPERIFDPGESSYQPKSEYYNV
jgi:hypothetical protein